MTLITPCNAIISRTYSSLFKAFTLAEVLIVLGIIGLIADMTIPTLINETEKTITITKLKKSYSDISQAIKLSEIDNGPLQDWEIGDFTVESSKIFYEKYLKPYLPGSTLCSEGGENYKCGIIISNQGINYTLKNGVGFSMVTQNNTIPLVLDVNGGRKPNKMGRDGFYYAIDKNNGLIPNGWKKGVTRQEIIDGPTDSDCKKDGESVYKNNSCAALIMYDGWKISDDYPW